jgi:hypothetical protein
MSLHDELETLRQAIDRDPAAVDLEFRRRFWHLIGQIKRSQTPDPHHIATASVIRDILYQQRLGKTISLHWLWLWLLGGLAMTSYYLWILIYTTRPTGSFLPDADLGAIVAGAMFFLYPFGRIISGMMTGIHFDGISRDIYYLPTLKINYTTYLKASPTKRMWFFFMAGAWTALTMILIGFLGFLLKGEWTAMLFGLLLALSELAGAILGGRWAGELGHFKRELKIVRDWQKLYG